MMKFKIGDKVNHPLYGKGEVIEGDVPEGDLLVHFFKKSLDCPDGFHKITAPVELKRSRKKRKKTK